MKQTLTFTIIMLLVLAMKAQTNNGKLLDFYAEETALFGVSDAKRNIDSYRGGRGVPVFDYDTEDKVCGDLSVVYLPSRGNNPARFGFKTQLWENYFDLGDKAVLSFQMKVVDDNAADSWNVILLDASSRAATTTLKWSNTKGKWKAFSIALKDLEKTANFDIDSIKLVQFEAGGFSKDAVVKFDRVGFADGEQFFGITDKTVEQRMSEAQASKPERIEQTMRKAAGSKYEKFTLLKAFGKLYLNEDLDGANRIIIEYAEKGLEQEKSLNIHHWDLFKNAMICRLYYNFSAPYGKFPGRMNQQAKDKLLELLWERTKIKNDIHWARQSVWYLDGSENHDLSSKSSCLVSSRIFMNEPDYKDRVYPDLGFGGGYAYMHAGYHGPNSEKIRVGESGGMANLKDGKQYTARDHYEAWVKFFKKYIPSRAEYGFLLEKYSMGYSKHSYNMLDLVHSLSGDEELRQMMGDFMNLYWAAYIQVSPHNVVGGAKCRNSKVKAVSPDAPMINFKMGMGHDSAVVWYYWNVLSDYTLPEVLWRMALDREGMGRFVFKTKGIGEEVTEMPRPAGTERSLVINPDGRYLDYTYVTPAYTLGCRMWHPLSVHSHLTQGGAGPWLGMASADREQALVVPVGLTIDPNNPDKHGKVAQRPMFKTAQHANTLIVMRENNFIVLSPDWFPYKAPPQTDQGIFLGKAWDEVKEDSGWVFLRRGKIYAAVRPVQRDTEYENAKDKELGAIGAQRPRHPATVKLIEETYKWNEDKTIMVLDNPYAPFIIHTGDMDQYGSFDHFSDQVKNARLELYKTAVPGFDEVVFTPPGSDKTEMVFSAANNRIPQIGGKYIEYLYPKTFESPYMKSEYKSGKIDITYDGEELELDFSGNRDNGDQAAFEQALDVKWREIFSDSGTNDWKAKWFLDGEVASVKNGPEGMQLTAGPQFANDAHHAVLWTKDSFKGDVKIEYDYTRTDFETYCVNILYIQATGSGEKPYVKDISKWNDLRKVPSMSMYYNHMNTYHISYAVNPGAGNEYIRARRYMPNRTGLKSTDLKPDYYPEGLFAAGVKHHITVIKKDRDIFMRIENDEQTYYCHMTNPDLPIVTEGRIGLRHMFTRSARYKNFKISTPSK